MPPRGASSSKSKYFLPELSDTLLASIDAAFTFACTPAHLVSQPAKKKRRIAFKQLRVVDDEEEEDERDQDAAMDDQHATIGGGGFLSADPSEANADASTSAGGGGFMMEEDENQDDIGGGGFVADSSPLSSAASSDRGGGGFVVDASSSPRAALEREDDDDSDEGSSTLFTNPPSLLPLSSLSRAFDALPSIPRSKRFPLLEAFGHVAEKNDEGVMCVSRDDFVAACRSIIREDRMDDGIPAEEHDEIDEDDDDEDQEEDDDDDSGDDGEEWQDPEMRGNVSRRQRGPTNTRPTRSNPSTAAPVLSQLVDEDEESALSSSGSDTRSKGRSSSKKSGGLKTSAITTKNPRPPPKSRDKTTSAAPSSKRSKGKGRGKERLKDGDRVLTAEELVEIEETFDLFFEGSIQREMNMTDREIGMEELRRVSRLLDAKNSEEDLIEMYEYACRNRGLIDIKAFTEVLDEVL